MNCATYCLKIKNFDSFENNCLNKLELFYEIYRRADKSKQTVNENLVKRHNWNSNSIERTDLVVEFGLWWLYCLSVEEFLLKSPWLGICD